ncbi:hypothetical protein Mapa_011747 [Marchantia paleacea]|nr:hypothetical protein Mapa_011747 [Marchantia paleacea]
MNTPEVFVNPELVSIKIDFVPKRNVFVHCFCCHVHNLLYYFGFCLLSASSDMQV